MSPGRVNDVFAHVGRIGFILEGDDSHLCHQEAKKNLITDGLKQTLGLLQVNIKSSQV